MSKQITIEEAIQTLARAFAKEVANYVQVPACKCKEEAKEEAKPQLEEKQPKKEPATKKTETADKALEDMTSKELYALCTERGIKVPKYGKSKAFYLEALNSSAEAGDAPVEETKEAKEEVKEEVEENPYKGIKVFSLYKMCKDRGLDVERQKKSQYYIDALLADDASKASESDSDDWGEEEEEAKPAPKKTPKAAKAPKKEKAKKAASVEDEDDDSDWDI